MLAGSRYKRALTTFMSYHVGVGVGLYIYLHKVTVLCLILAMQCAVSLRESNDIQNSRRRTRRYPWRFRLKDPSQWFPSRTGSSSSIVSWRAGLAGTKLGTTTRTDSVPAIRRTSGWNWKEWSCDGGLLDGSREASSPDDIGQLPSALGMAGGSDSLLVLDWILDLLHRWRGCKLHAACQRICPRRWRQSIVGIRHSFFILTVNFIYRAVHLILTFYSFIHWSAVDYLRHNYLFRAFSTLQEFLLYVARAVLSNWPVGPEPRAPKPNGAPNSPCVIFFISRKSLLIV